LLQEPHSVTSQKTAFFIVPAVKASNLTSGILLMLCSEVNSLLECVSELRHDIKRLEEQNSELQAMVHTTEESYTLLQKEYKKVCDKMSR
jgi:hypothetical protein